jgi:hypothetical protein
MTYNKIEMWLWCYFITGKISTGITITPGCDDQDSDEEFMQHVAEEGTYLL